MTPAEVATYPLGASDLAARSRVPPERRFFFAMSVICALTIFVGFAPSFYLKDVIHAPPPLSAMTRVHGIVFTAWMLMFVAQAGLIRFDRAALHRRLGVLGAVLFGIVVAVGITTAITAGRLGHAPPDMPSPLVFMSVPILAMIAAATLMTAALWNRPRRDYHMRYSLAAFMTMTPPATHRLAVGAGFSAQALWIGLVIADILLIAAILYDVRTRKSVHPAYAWSAFVYLMTQAGMIWAFASPSWMPIAEWLIQT